MAFYQKEDKEFEEKVVQVRRVTKVVTGGKRMGFRVLAVVGDKKGKVGAGIGKASEVAVAIRKAVESAKKKMITFPQISGTIPHEVVGKLGASSVLIRPAPSGRGVIAGGAVRVVLELAGVRDVVAKNIGSSNAINSAKATLRALSSLRDLAKAQEIRGKQLDVRYVQDV
jgi:small subunit ribosomal protein S5